MNVSIEQRGSTVVKIAVNIVVVRACMRRSVAAACGAYKVRMRYVCMSTYIYVRIYIYVYIQTYIHTYIHIHIYIHIYMYIYASYVCMYVS